MVQTARWTPGLWGLAPGQRPIDPRARGQERVGKDINPHPVYQARALSAAPICCLALSPRAAQVPSSGLPPLTSCQRPGVTGIRAELRSLVRLSPHPEPAPGGVPARLVRDGARRPREVWAGPPPPQPAQGPPCSGERQMEVSESQEGATVGTPDPPTEKLEQAQHLFLTHSWPPLRDTAPHPTSPLPPAAASVPPGSRSRSREVDPVSPPRQPSLALPSPVRWALTLPRPRALAPAQTPRAVRG